MKHTILELGTLRVKAMEMIMGVDEEVVREYYNVDSSGFMRIALNALLLEHADRLLLIDPGCATFLPRSLAEEYDLHMRRSVEEEIVAAGYSAGQVSDVLFTHLHFDHGSGALQRIIGGIEPVFANARFVVSRDQLSYIEKQTKEEQNSFFHKLLRYIDNITYFEDWSFDGVDFYVSHGHTNNMIVPLLHSDDHDILFASDLIPMKLHMQEGAWSYYDNDKEVLQKEKDKILSSLKPGSEIIYFHEIYGSD